LTKITNDLPTWHIPRSQLNIPPGLRLADETFNVPGKIDMLIGADLFLSLLCKEQIPGSLNTPTIQRTKLGWIVGGPIPEIIYVNQCTITSHTATFKPVERSGNLKNYALAFQGSKKTHRPADSNQHQRQAVQALVNRGTARSQCQPTSSIVQRIWSTPTQDQKLGAKQLSRAGGRPTNGFVNHKHDHSAYHGFFQVPQHAKPVRTKIWYPSKNHIGAFSTAKMKQPLKPQYELDRQFHTVQPRPTQKVIKTHKQQSHQHYTHAMIKPKNSSSADTCHVRLQSPSLHSPQLQLQKYPTHHVNEHQFSRTLSYKPSSRCFGRAGMLSDIQTYLPFVRNKVIYK
jgi:Putative peptidase (DUF1758)